MSELFRSLFLGILQGLTEFLPVSSSGHLEILNQLWGGEEGIDSDFTMVLLVHLGTALSILYVYRQDIANIIKGVFSGQWNDDTKLVVQIIISMLPALVLGLAFEEKIEAMFQGGIWHVGAFLIFTGVVLWITPKITMKSGKIDNKLAFLIGLAQAVAIMPGISRSGMTIAAALILGIQKKEAARFSFLMVLPVILGKSLLDVLKGDLVVNSENGLSIGIALIASCIVGILACKWMISIVQNSKLSYFAYYCMAVGAIVLVTSLYG